MNSYDETLHSIGIVAVSSKIKTDFCLIVRSKDSTIVHLKKFYRQQLYYKKFSKRFYHARLIKIPVISKGDCGQEGRKAY